MKKKNKKKQNNIRILIKIIIYNLNTDSSKIHFTV
jgi:hypothetical protein